MRRFFMRWRRRHRHFLALPLEIRLEIYKYLLMFPSPVSVTISHRKSPDFFRLSQSDRKRVTVTGISIAVDMVYSRAPELSFIAASLLRVNKQVYNEALPILYTNVTFSSPDSRISLLHFIDRLSVFAMRQVRRLRIFVWSFLLSENLISGQESLKWTVLCSQIARLEGLNTVEVVYPSADLLQQGSVEFHWRRYAKALNLVPGKKLLVIEESDVNLCHASFHQLQVRFDEIQNFGTKNHEAHYILEPSNRAPNTPLRKLDDMANPNSSCSAIPRRLKNGKKNSNFCHPSHTTSHHP